MNGDLECSGSGAQVRRGAALGRLIGQLCELGPMPFMRHKPPAAHLRAVRDARAHGFGDDMHGKPLQLRQNVAPEIHAIERPVAAPRHDGFALR
jgi:hypothetical protein